MSVTAPFTLHLPDVFPEPMLGVDDEGQIVYANAAAQDWFGPIRFKAARDVLPLAALAALAGEQPEPDACRRVDGERRVALWTDCTPPQSNFNIVMARDLTQQIQASEQLNNRMRRLEVVHSITLALARGEDIDRISRKAFDNLQAVVGIRRGSLIRFADRRLHVLFAWNDGRWSQDDAQSWTLQETPASSAIYRRMPVQMRTAGTDAIRWKEFRTLDRQGIKAMLYVPLIAGDDVLGLLSLGKADVAGFTPDDVQAATEVAAQLSTALLRRRLDDALTSHQRELEEAVRTRTRELEEAQEALIQAAKLSTLGELAAGLAHELSQPIGVISGHAELLRHIKPDPERLERSLGIIQASSERMARLVEDMRNFARAGAEVMEPFDVRDAIEMALELSCRVHPEVLVRWTQPPDPIIALGDQHRVEQVLINLLTNARYATAQQGNRQVDLQARLQDGEVLLTVTDEGGGVPEKIREKLFAPFFTTKGNEGTGLGLSISTRIVHEHGGRLEIQNIGPGARFTVYLQSV